MTTKLTSKGQVTVPKRIRSYLGLRPGAVVGFVLGRDGEVILKAVEDDAARLGTGRFSKLRGTLATGRNTDELMRLLRGTETDAHDRGLK